MEDNSNYLVTFGLICYKQERFIKEAVLSALSQTYSPLEIVITDDCSPDNTFQIIEEIIANYNGPHEIILNRNTSNLGLAGNINRMWELSSGEFLVIQAGDDISVPHRTSKMVDAWLSAEARPSIVYSNEMLIDEDGEYISGKNTVKITDTALAIKHTLSGGTNFVIGGAACGYAREIHFGVGPLLADVIAEDFIYSFRSLLNGGSIGISEPLIMYRKNTESIMGQFKKNKIPRKRWLMGRLAKLVEYKRAIDKYGGVGQYFNWLLERDIKTTKQQVKAQGNGWGGRIYFIIWILATVRIKYILNRIGIL